MLAYALEYEATVLERRDSIAGCVAAWRPLSIPNLWLKPKAALQNWAMRDHSEPIRLLLLAKLSPKICQEIRILHSSDLCKNDVWHQMMRYVLRSTNIHVKLFMLYFEWSHRSRKNLCCRAGCWTQCRFLFHLSLDNLPICHAQGLSIDLPLRVLPSDRTGLGLVWNYDITLQVRWEYRVIPRSLLQGLLDEDFPSFLRRMIARGIQSFGTW